MKDWPHAPLHRLAAQGAYMVTAGTYQKKQLFHSRERLALLNEALFASAEKYGWELQAWAVFANHYHIVAHSPASAANLRELIQYLHSQTALAINAQDHAVVRKVWYQYWDSQLTYPKSYDARLAYVHNNAVHHGLVREAQLYPWCSAAWFALRAPQSLYKRIMAMKTDRVNVRDDFTVERGDW
ncbi:MAG: REP-associated tyrosine transposase [Candidatus Acidiferrales bacterium]